MAPRTSKRATTSRKDKRDKAPRMNKRAKAPRMSKDAEASRKNNCEKGRTKQPASERRHERTAARKGERKKQSRKVSRLRKGAKKDPKREGAKNDQNAERRTQEQLQKGFYFGLCRHKKVAMKYLFLPAIVALISVGDARLIKGAPAKDGTKQKSKTKNGNHCAVGKKDSWFCPTAPLTLTAGIDISVISPGREGAQGTTGADAPDFGLLRALAGTSVEENGFALSLIKFDLPQGIPTDATVKSATLRIVALSGTGGDPVSLKRVVSPWDTTATGANIPELEASDLAELPEHGDNGQPASLELDVTNDVAQFITDPESNHGWALVNPKTDVADTFLMVSFDSDIFQTPTLEIIFD